MKLLKLTEHCCGRVPPLVSWSLRLKDITDASNEASKWSPQEQEKKIPIQSSAEGAWQKVIPIKCFASSFLDVFMFSLFPPEGNKKVSV